MDILTEIKKRLVAAIRYELASKAKPDAEQIALRVFDELGIKEARLVSKILAMEIGYLSVGAETSYVAHRVEHHKHANGNFLAKEIPMRTTIKKDGRTGDIEIVTSVPFITCAVEDN